jgi:conjugative relaxase-like TrwC/TraI family protein
MLRASPPLTVGQASHYYKSEFSLGDYYAEREVEGIVASCWHGYGAERLGLSGRVKSDEFTHLLQGQDPSGRRVLVAHREGLNERRAGWDVTVSPHKSVSLTALAGGDSRLLKAHDRAVEEALSELERHVQAWVHGGREVVTTGEMVAASFRHETSRALDPQLHSHCVVLNVTRRADGEWRAVDARGVFRAQRRANEIYQAELRKELLALGYEVQSYKDGRSGRQRMTGIAGFNDEHLKHFSNRSREIEKELKARGLRSGRHAERVALATRKTKAKEIDREALLWNWRTAVREVGLRFPTWEKERLVSPGRLSPVRERELLTRVAVNGARDHLSERRAVFRLSELEREALARGRDSGVTIDDVRKDILSRDDLVVADRSDAVLARVTTERAIEEERAPSSVAAAAARLSPCRSECVASARTSCASRATSSGTRIVSWLRHSRRAFRSRGSLSSGSSMKPVCCRAARRKSCSTGRESGSQGRTGRRPATAPCGEGGLAFRALNRARGNRDRAPGCDPPAERRGPPRGHEGRIRTGRRQPGSRAPRARRPCGRDPGPARAARRPSSGAGHRLTAWATCCALCAVAGASTPASGRE